MHRHGKAGPSHCRSPSGEAGLAAVALTVHEAQAVQVFLLERLLTLLPLKARGDVLQDPRRNPFRQKAVQLVIWVFCACCEGLQQFQAKRLSRRDFQTCRVCALMRVQARVCNGSYFELLCFSEGVRVFGLAQVRNDVLCKVMLCSELEPVLDDILQRRRLAVWIRGVC